MSAILNQETIDELLEMVEDSPEILIEIIDAYAEQGGILLDQFTNAIQHHDSNNLREAAHSLKGASYNVGAVSLAELAANLENKGAEASWQDMDDLFIKLQHCYTETITALQTLKQTL